MILYRFKFILQNLSHEFLVICKFYCLCFEDFQYHLNVLFRDNNKKRIEASDAMGYMNFIDWI